MILDTYHKYHEHIHIVIWLSYVHARIHGSGTWSSITGDRPGVAWEVVIKNWE